MTSLLYWKDRYDSVWFLGDMNRMIRSNSLAMLMNTSRNPERKPFLARGITILAIRFQKLQPAMSAASSSSRPICSMFAVPDLLAKGRCLTMVASRMMAKVPYREGMGPWAVLNISR